MTTSFVSLGELGGRFGHPPLELESSVYTGMSIA